MSYRIGIGYDIHNLVDARQLFIGGVEIPYIKGLFGHSDGDVLLHAICDAMLGAIGEGDIGEHFPDTDPKYHNIASSELLKITGGLVSKKGFLVNNIDTIIVAQEPKLFPFKRQIKKRISEILGINEDRVNVKAKTNEGVDGVGRKEAIIAYASVILALGGAK